MGVTTVWLASTYEIIIVIQVIVIVSALVEGHRNSSVVKRLKEPKN